MRAPAVSPRSRPITRCFEEYLFHYVPFAPRSVMRALARRFSRGQCNELEGVVVPSRPMRDALRDYGVTTAMEIIPTGIPLAEFAGGDGSRFRAAHGIPPHRPMLLFVGRVAHEKNIGFLLRMMERLREKVPDALLVVCGEGPAEAPLRREAQATGLAVRIAPPLDVAMLRDRRDEGVQRGCAVALVRRASRPSRPRPPAPAYLAGFSTWPPNSKRIADSSLSWNSALPRELKRS